MKIFNKSEWKKVKLGDICDILDSRRIPISEEKRIKGKYPYYGANGIQGYINDYIFDEELVLLAEDGGNFGSKTKPIAYKINGKTWVNNHAHVLKAKDEIISTDFLLYSLMFYDVTKLITGTTRKKLTRAGMEKITLSIPTLSIQNKITNNLEKIENFIFLRKNQLNFLNELNKSLFTTMFGDIKTNDKNWEIYYWKDVLNIKNGKNQKQVEDINGKYPIYGSGGIIGRSNAYICNENSIIIGRKGNINKPILVKEKFWNVDTAFGLEVKSEKMSYHYLYYFCLFYDFEIHNKAVTIPSLVKSDLEKIVLPVPPIELQNKFAERIEKIEKLKFEIEKSIEIAQNLYDSLISKYFDN